MYDKEKTDKELILRNEVMEYLFRLRESGKTNMFGAGSYLRVKFGMTTEQAEKYLFYWIENFDELDEKRKRKLKVGVRSK